jgi:hypothetical protein
LLSLLNLAKNRHGVEEYYIYDPDRHDLTGWLRVSQQLVPIENINGWTSPRLQIKFVLQPHTLTIYRPDGEEFLGFLQLDQKRQLAEAKQLAAEAKQRDAEAKAHRLAAKLKALGIDPYSL